ncbi:hypothetical protein D3Z51_19930 [Clostridiaceae bacterium]|nr:hypothetical protein [Clostridiaceae bacterium]RKI07474.1 hypothetical protein D7V81_19945 [bacterium 1XD21-70]
MDNIIHELIQENIGQVIDKRRDRLLMGDEVYQQDCSDTQELLNRYEALNLPKADRILINDLIACLETRDNRCADLSYLCGFSDAIKLLHELGILKEFKE